TGELQRLSRGRAHAGLNTHNRLGYQLLTEDPETFFSIAMQRPENLVHDPFPYLGGPLRHTVGNQEVVRTARALLPFLENLARSHGNWVDQKTDATSETTAADHVRLLDASEVNDLPDPSRARFCGFVPVSGWQKQEGPLPVAYLPVFHW